MNFCRAEQKSSVSPLSPHTTDRTTHVKPAIRRLELKDVATNDLRKAATTAAGTYTSANLPSVESVAAFKRLPDSTSPSTPERIVRIDRVSDHSLGAAAVWVLR
jgi:hypothetical protein